MKRLLQGQRRINNKLLCNSCGFKKTLFDRQKQDSHTCPVYNEPNENKSYMITCKAPLAVENRKKNLDSLTKELKELDTSPAIATGIIGCCNHAHNGNTPSVREYGHIDFVGGITLRKIIKGQASIGWTSFLCARWGVKWKEVQQQHYLLMNKKKSARLWIIAILKN